MNEAVAALAMIVCANGIFTSTYEACPTPHFLQVAELLRVSLIPKALLAIE